MGRRWQGRDMHDELSIHYLGRGGNRNNVPLEAPEAAALATSSMLQHLARVAAHV